MPKAVPIDAQTIAALSETQRETLMDIMTMKMIIGTDARTPLKPRKYSKMLLERIEMQNSVTVKKTEEGTDYELNYHDQGLNWKKLSGIGETEGEVLMEEFMGPRMTAALNIATLEYDNRKQMEPRLQNVPGLENVELNFEAGAPRTMGEKAHLTERQFTALVKTW